MAINPKDLSSQAPDMVVHRTIIEWLRTLSDPDTGIVEYAYSPIQLLTPNIVPVTVSRTVTTTLLTIALTANQINANNDVLEINGVGSNNLASGGALYFGIGANTATRIALAAGASFGGAWSAHLLVIRDSTTSGILGGVVNAGGPSGTVTTHPVSPTTMTATWANALNLYFAGHTSITTSHISQTYMIAKLYKAP